MDSSDRSKPPQPPGGPTSKARRPKGNGVTGDAFDLWLQRGLHQLYDDVASEPIPDALLRLIEDDRSRKDK
ncbi:NepR family anti-sigma factor [Falsiroseomonas sp. E2-1-a20]|uniref:NepR family anti-sigma factor n=1 Tax=Falsiroseomonas sp. E2-1-a20 TaxID=3239300 RepID=UPI003F39449E